VRRAVARVRDNSHVSRKPYGQSVQSMCEQASRGGKKDRFSRVEVTTGPHV
jgi:hypothetical protein